MSIESSIYTQIVEHWKISYIYTHTFTLAGIHISNLSGNFSRILEKFVFCIVINLGCMCFLVRLIAFTSLKVTVINAQPERSIF